MSKINESQIKMALSAAKDVSAAKDERRKYANLRQADLLESSQIRTNQRALENLVASYLTKAGFEVDKFEKIREQHQTELRRILEERKAEAVKHSSYVKETFRYGVDNRVKTVEQLQAPPKYELLNSPFLIWQTQGIDFPETHVEPSNSRAKFTLHSDKSSGSEEMSFYFLWDNPSDKFAVINVDGYLIVNGFCRCGSDGGFFPGDRRSGLVLKARLHLLEWWNQPPTQPLPKVDQIQEVLRLSTNTGGWSDPGAIEFEEVFRGYDLRYELFLIPPKGVVVFEVALSIILWNADGSVDVDFASGDFQVGSPGVLLSILT